MREIVGDMIVRWVWNSFGPASVDACSTSFAHFERQVDLVSVWIKTEMNNTSDFLLDHNVGFFTVPDYAVFVVMLSISTGIGVYFGCFGQNEQSTEEYLLGGRQMKTLPIAISLIASWV